MSNKTPKIADSFSVKPAEVILPFADDKSAVTSVFARNRGPREQDYQRWLKQHFDMAYGLGFEHDSQQGQGLKLSATNKKLEIKAASNGGLKVDSSGLAINIHQNGGLQLSGSGLRINELPSTGGLKVEGGQLKVAIDSSSGLQSNNEGVSVKISSSLRGLKTDSGGLNVMVSSVGGLQIANDGIEARLATNGTDINYWSGSIRSNSNGLWLNVGNQSSGTRHGLKGYLTKSNNIALGVDHAQSLTFNAQGQLTLNRDNPWLAIRFLASLYGATHYISSDDFYAFAKKIATYRWKVILVANFKSTLSDGLLKYFANVNIAGSTYGNEVMTNFHDHAFFVWQSGLNGNDPAHTLIVTMSYGIDGSAAEPTIHNFIKL